MVKKADAGSPWKFIYVDKFLQKFEVVCTGTESDEYVKLLNDLLFLKRNPGASE